MSDETTDVTVREPFALTDPAALMTGLTAYSEARSILLRWLDDNLTPGVDYMLIHRKVGMGQNKRACENGKDRTSKTCPKCGGKATLCKPGSEKLCGLLRLTPIFKRDLDTWEMFGKREGMVCMICQLVSEDGVVRAEGRGCRTQEQDYGDVNKTIKMVQKSAQTDAVLRCGGLSEVFTQDLEDMLPSAPEVQAKPKRKTKADTVTEQEFVSPILPPPDPCWGENAPIGDDYELPISHAEIIALTEAVRASGKTEARFKEYVRGEYGIKTRKEIPVRLYDEIMQWAREGI